MDCYVCGEPVSGARRSKFSLLRFWSKPTALSGKGITVTDGSVLNKKVLFGVMLLLAATVLVTPAMATDLACASPQVLNMGTGATNGCAYAGNNFVNFDVSAATGSGDASFPVAASGETTKIEFTASDTVPSLYTLDFKTTGQTSGNASCASSSWCVLENGSTAKTASQNISYDAQTTGEFYGISLADGTLQGNTLLAGDVIAAEEQFCLGNATFSCAAGNPNYGYVEITQTSNGSGGYTTVYTVCTPGASGCTVSHPTAASISFAAQTEIGIDDTITISTVSGQARTVYLDSFNNNFNEASEPSTLILIGTALLAVGFRGSRRKKEVEPAPRWPLPSRASAENRPAFVAGSPKLI